MDDVLMVKDQTPKPTVAELFGVGDFQDYCAKVLRGWRVTVHPYGAGMTIVEPEEDAVLSIADALFNDCFVSFSLYSSGRSAWPVEELSLTGRAAERDQMILYFDSQVIITPYRESEFIDMRVDLSIESYFESEVVRRFARFEDVDAIYADRYLDEQLVYILVSWKHYDSERMRTLLESELAIIRKFSDRILSFRYMPLLGQQPRNLMHPAARCIFAR